MAATIGALAIFKAATSTPQQVLNTALQAANLAFREALLEPIHAGHPKAGGSTSDTSTATSAQG